MAASLVVGTGVTVGYGLATGFDRAADQAGLPDVIARFDPESRETLDERVRALPNLAARSYRFERTNVGLWAGGHHNHRGAMHVVMGGRRGYLIADGRDLSGRPGEVVVERGLARDWDLSVGDRLAIGRPGEGREVVGISVSPDNVAYPLARAARVYVRRRRAAQRRAAVAQRPVEGRRHADAGALGLVRPRPARVRHARGRPRAAEPGRGDRDLAAGRVLARRAAGRGNDARRERARRRAAPARHLRRAARARLLARQDRGAAGEGGGARRAARGRPGDRARRARGGRPGRRPARVAERAPAGRRARAAAARRAGRRGGDRRGRRDVAGLARRAAAAGGDPARRRRSPRGRTPPRAGWRRSARASRPPPGRAGSPPWRRSASARASSR